LIGNWYFFTDSRFSVSNPARRQCISRPVLYRIIVVERLVMDNLKAAKASPKKPYTAPKLCAYGSISEMTQSTSRISGKPDGAKRQPAKTG
jgi:hypothetical protein